MSDSAPLRPPRALVLCFDGTGDSYDEKNSNVVKLFATLRKGFDDEQMCYYQSGVGTYENPNIFWTPIMLWLTEWLDKGFGLYLSAHVIGGYNFLMENYRQGDKVCLFGFSRGAYTARALAGFLTKVGLLPRGNVEQIAFAYRLFAKDDEKNNTLAKGFKSQICLPIEIEFLGVWDTVASTGFITTRNLPFTSNNYAIKTFRHALALDERRVRFEPTYFQTMSPPWKNESFLSKLGYHHRKKDHKGHEAQPIATDVKEVWFVGDHCDVGGGQVNNSDPHSVANIPLKWMIQEIIETGCGIKFDDKSLKSLGIDTALSPARYFGLGEVYDDEKRQIREMRSEDLSQDVAMDALQEIHDSLRSRRYWWIVEFFPPNVVSWQDSSNKWRSRVELFHRGRRRYVNRTGRLYFHESVRARMALAGYRPRVYYSPDKVEYTW